MMTVKVRMILSIAVITAAMSVALEFPAFAASLLTIAPSEGGVFLLQGTDMDNVAAMDITITYDAASLANPTVAQGTLVSGAMMAVNPNTSGVIRIAIIRTTPFKGSGGIATLIFKETGASPGKILSLSAHLANLDGKPVPSQTQVVSPTTGETDAVASTPSSVPNNAAPAAVVPPPPPMIVQQVAPRDGSARQEDAQAQEKEEPAQSTIEAKRDPPLSEEKVEPHIEPTKKVIAQKSVLERFHEYRGERTVKAFTALFEQESLFGFRQIPSVVLSDDKATVKIAFIFFSGNKTAPEVTLQGAKLISLQKDRDNTNTWIVEAKPVRGVYAASLTVLQDAGLMEFPLTVAPRINLDLDKSGKVTDNDFVLFLKKRTQVKTGGGPAVNTEDAPGYREDYIFTANYLVEQTAEGGAKSGKQTGKGVFR